MKLSVQEFLDTVQNPNTKKEYRYGIKKFYEQFGKNAQEILEMRKDDLTQRAGENLIEYKNRVARFEKEIEKFHVIGFVPADVVRLKKAVWFRKLDSEQVRLVDQFLAESGRF